MALFFIGLFLGLVFADGLRSFLGRARTSLRRLFRSSSGNPPAVAQTPLVEIVPAVSEAAEEPLAIRLRKLESQFVSVAEDAAHPREFLDQPSFHEAAALFEAEAVPPKTVMQYVLGANWGLSCAALAGLASRLDRESLREQVVSGFDRLTPWAMHYALAYFLSCGTRPPVGAPYVNTKEWWKDNPIIQLDAQEFFDESERLGDAASFGSALDAVPASNYPFIRGLLERVNNNLARQLIVEIDARQRAIVDRTFLASFGRFWGQGEKLDLLVEPETWHDMLANAEVAIRAEPPRSLLASGDPRIGKTSFLRLLAKRLEREGWIIFEAGGADLMAGQQWFGQLEGRIQKAVEELSASKKLIWYIPDILQIALSGTHQGQAASILEQILPAVSSGRLIVWTEASPAGAARLLRLRPQLRNIFELIRFEPLSKEETLALAHSVTTRLSDEAGLEIDPACADTALASARQYLSSTGFPGSALDLLKSAIARAVKGANRTVTPNDVIMSLSQATGVPAAILDSKERADLASIRRYFAARVMGQEEAVSTMVERIAMLKAGLNDPGKPIGVFLFAGPTGTGKTELAKALAEFLFGSVGRLIRLDMSEYQTPRSTCEDSRQRPIPPATDTLDRRACASSRSPSCCSTSSRRRMRRSGTCFCRCSTRPPHRCRGPGRGFPSLHHHPDDQPRRNQPPGRRPRLRCRHGCIFKRADRARDRPDVPARVPEPARQGDRVPAARPRADAQHSQEGARAACLSGAASRTANGPWSGRRRRWNSFSKRASRRKWALAR